MNGIVSAFPKETLNALLASGRPGNIGFNELTPAFGFPLSW